MSTIYQVLYTLSILSTSMKQYLFKEEESGIQATFLTERKE